MKTEDVATFGGSVARIATAVAMQACGGRVPSCLILLPAVLPPRTHAKKLEQVRFISVAIRVDLSVG